MEHSLHVAQMTVAHKLSVVFLQPATNKFWTCENDDSTRCIAQPAFGRPERNANPFDPSILVFMQAPSTRVTTRNRMASLTAN